MPDDDRNILDTLGGLLGSVLKPVIGEKRIQPLKEAIGAGLIGGTTHGDPYAVDRYWGTLEQIKQRKQLQELWHNLHPNEPMPLGAQSAADLMPQYSQPTKYGVIEYPPGGGVPFPVPGTVPAAETKPPTSEAGLRMWVAQHPEDTAAAGALKGYEQFHERLPKAEKPTAPRVHVFPDGRQRLFYPDGTFVDLPPPEGFTPKSTTGKSDLDTSITADRMKGVGWHMPDGSSVDPDKFKTRREALAAGAVAFPKDDETKFKQYDTVAQAAREMLVLLPSVADKIGTKDWPTLAGRALSQKLRGAQLKTLAKRDPALAQYLERLQTLSLNMTKQVLPAGRIPVWDQQLLMGVFVSPEMNAPTQQSQLQDILKRSETSKENAMLYAKGTLIKTPQTSDTLTPESAAAQVQEGDTFTLKGKNYIKQNGQPVPLEGPIPAH